MKILQLIYTLDTGGSEKFAVELSNKLAETNEVILCSFQSIDEGMWLPKKISKKVRLIDLKIKRKYSIANLFRIFRLLNKEKPDVVHIHSSLIMLYFLWIIPFYKNIIFIHTVHTTLTRGYRKTFKVINLFSFLLGRLINVCISENILQIYRTHFPRLRFEHIDNGIEPMKKTEQFSKVKKEILGYKKTRNTKVFTAIGNYSKYKNFPLLARVFRKLEKKGLDVILLIIGKDKTTGQQNFKKVQLEKGENTYLLGLKPNIADYLINSDALIMSSTKEGMPIVILEALSLGIPVISTPAGGVVDIIQDGINGFIASDFSESALFNAIVKFIKTTPKEVCDIKENNILKFNEKYSIQICKNKYEVLYNRLRSRL